MEDFEDQEGRPTLVSAQSLITAQSPDSEKCSEKQMECYICARVLKSKHKVYTHPGTGVNKKRLTKKRRRTVDKICQQEAKSYFITSEKIPFFLSSPF